MINVRQLRVTVPLRRNRRVGISALLFCVCLVPLAMGLAGHVPGTAKTRFAVVDLALVVRKNQEATVSLLASGTADRRTRDGAVAAAQGFGRRLDLEVVKLSKDCKCVLLMREAVIAGDVEDMTPTLLSRLTKN